MSALSTGNRKARPVTQTLRAIPVRLKPKKSGDPEIIITAVLAEEEEYPPKGEKPIRWILLVTLEVTTLEPLNP